MSTTHEEREAQRDAARDKVRWRAMAQPNAVARAEGISFACLVCRANGQDSAGENAVLPRHGDPSCRLVPAHAGAIRKALGLRAAVATDNGHAAPSSAPAPDPAVASLVRRRHPALDIDEEQVSLARIVDGDVQIVTSNRVLLAAAGCGDMLTTKPRAYPPLAGRWPSDDVMGFLTGAPAPSLASVIALAIRAFERSMEFPQREHATLLATWSVATYFYPLFLTFPRLALSGEREAGKSKVLSLLHATSWNALMMLAPTPAVLFRLTDEWRPTLLLDEMEGLSHDDKREILGIINAGYKAGATVPRCEGDREKHVESYPVYAPLAMAAIKSPNATTEDRCIPVVLQRGTDRAKLNAEVRPGDDLFASIRAGCHRLLLTRWRDVAKTYAPVDLPTWLNARARELWKPLLTVATLADREEPSASVTADLLTLARAHVAERPGATPEAEAVLAELAERLGSESEVVVRPNEVRESLGRRLGWRDPPTPEAVGAWLRRLGFRRTGKDRAGARYEVSAQRLADAQRRYGDDDGDGPAPPQTTVTPSPSHPNPLNLKGCDGVTVVVGGRDGDDAQRHQPSPKVVETPARSSAPPSNLSPFLTVDLTKLPPEEETP